MKNGDYYSPYKLFTGLFVPEALARLKDLSPGAKLAFGRLARYAGEKGECFPAAETLAEEIGVGDRQVRRYLSELEELKLIQSIRRGSTSNLYRFTWSPVLDARCIPDDVRSDRTDMSGQTGQMCPPKRVIEESQLNINSGGCTPKLLTEEEWLQTTLMVQHRFPSVDGVFMGRLIQNSIQAAISSGLSAEEVTDHRLAGLVETSLKTDNIKFAGLLLSTVPQIIRNLAKSQFVSGGRK